MQSVNPPVISTLVIRQHPCKELSMIYHSLLSQNNLAASLEVYSRHPLASGVLEAARTRNITTMPPENVTEHPGDGLRGTVGGHKVHITGRKQAESTYGLVIPVAAPASGMECVLFIDGQLAA